MWIYFRKILQIGSCLMMTQPRYGNYFLETVQLLSIWLLATPRTTACPVQRQLPELDQTHVHWAGGAIQPYHHLTSPPPPSFNLPSIRVCSNQSVLHIWWPKYWSFIFSISPSSEYSGLISFRMDWLDLLAVQGLSKVFSNTTVHKHQFFSTQLPLQSNSHIHTWLLEKS